MKLFLDRATELLIAGNRPSAYGKIKVGAKKDGTITAWQSDSWATGGVAGGGLSADLFPYVYRKIPNRRLNHTAVSVNTGSARAWRAPNHQQASYLTCSALEDLAAKLKMDPLDVFLKNADAHRPRRRLQLAAQQSRRADRLEEDLAPARRFRLRPHQARPRSSASEPGAAPATAASAAPPSTPTAAVQIELGSQDLGTGTRTIIAMVAAETLGLPVSAITVKIGDSNYPPSGASGGSTTVGGVSASTRKATVNALAKLFAVAAPSLGSTPTTFEAVDGRIRVKGNSSKSLTWDAACRKLGANKISETGENNPRTAEREGLNTGGVGGVQMADVSVDIETGVVKMNRIVAVQDCGLIINPKTAESQILGACIMSICGALMEERIVDQNPAA